MAQPGVVGLHPDGVVAEALGQSTQTQQALAEICDLERGERGGVLGRRHLERLATKADHEVALGGKADGFQAEIVDDLEQFVEAGADPLSAELDVVAVAEHLVLKASTNAVACLEHLHLLAAVDKILSGDEPGQASSNDGAVDHVTLLLQIRGPVIRNGHHITGPQIHPDLGLGLSRRPARCGE